MRVLVAGASGFLGSALVDRLRGDGAEVHRVVRSLGRGDDAVFDVGSHTLDLSALPGGTLDGVDVVFAVGGEPLTPRRWGPGKREAIRSSRIALVGALAHALARTRGGPSVLVSMSAVGIYGERGDEMLSEDSPAGKGFIPDLCRGWEGAAAPARTNGVRVVSARSGIILGPGGGFIEKVEPIFRHGFGGRLGSGRQWMSWIALDDAVEILIRLATDDAFSGPVNLTSPNPVRNREFTKILADVIGRPALFRVPRTAMVLATGRRVTNEFLLQSARVMPSRLLAAGTAFRHPTAHDAIRASMVGR